MGKEAFIFYVQICSLCKGIKEFLQSLVKFYLFTVSEGCEKADIEAPWLGSMRFTYKKQTPPWLDRQYHANHKISVPTGGHITFYCANNWERPKKDVWDNDNSDGLIKGFCSHKGEVSVAMTPSSKSCSWL